MVDDGLQCREFNKGMAFDDQAAQKIKKVIAALKITSGAQTDCWEGVGTQGIGGVIVLMCLVVSPKRSVAMIFVGEKMA